MGAPSYHYDPLDRRPAAAAGFSGSMIHPRSPEVIAALAANGHVRVVGGAAGPERVPENPLDRCVQHDKLGFRKRSGGTERMQPGQI
ncbi:MAG: hypothetical protein WD603_01700, partial [Patescibacteria group bacterium]